MSVPNPREVREFQFKLLCGLRIHDEGLPVFYDKSVNFVATACKYGLIFVSQANGFKVIESQKIVDLYADEIKKPDDTTHYPCRFFDLPGPASNLEVSYDNQFLAISYRKDEESVINVYDIPSFFAEEETILSEFRTLSSVSSLRWNPANLMLVACLENGSVNVFERKNNEISINSIPAEAQATCICWSPKGKQIIIGSANGTLSQFKPELKIVKTIPPPPSPNPLSVLSVQWLSNFQFAAVYNVAANSERPITALYIVNTPKTGPVTYTNYEDICYSSRNLRSPQFYLIHQQNWNVLLVASATSMDLGVLALQNDTWEQWIQDDDSRVELPLSTVVDSKDETCPTGMAIDTSVQYNYPIGENQTLPPMPLLLIMSNEGLLSIYFMINILPSVGNICSPPTPLPDLGGLHHFRFPTFSVKHEEYEEINSQRIKEEQVALASSPTYDEAECYNEVEVVSTQLVSHPQPSWLGISSAQTSSVPSWASTATPIPSSSLSSSTKGLAAEISISTSTAAASSIFGIGSKSAQPFTIPGTQITITPVVTSAGIIKQLPAVTSTPMYTVPSSSQQNLMTAKPIANIQPEVKKTERVTPQYIDISPVKLAVLDEADEDTSSVSAMNDDVIMAAISEAVSLFNTEFNEMKYYTRTMSISVGTDEEREDLEQQVVSIENFYKDLKETIRTQGFEVHTLKNNLLESFNWVEDAKSKEEQYRDPHFIKLMNAQDTDPLISRKVSSIEHLNYYIDSQIMQVNDFLDKSWNKHQNESKSKVYVSSLETIYQALVTLNNIIYKQRITIEDIEQKLEARDRKTSNRVSLRSDLSTSPLSKDSE